ncbi:NAD-dependent succinate-semialdehyde dehydrogenase [Rheinheimera sp. 1928-s]|uniref:NAD-dependent succinate-semialdehyde dehydrogenase n=1 Tax=Rheinheimera sp. 1928-s TaxID=3033803 RepID=UPI00260CF16F|nr:NAD-dependent succinate-semialdehyde dehydrogenase [Rheinheimera sp. 1928-s]MDF3124612.1 NAD-dependent succinate-semialdehyde dehydrogenase [Rheinheimera sp. 1928-s]
MTNQTNSEFSILKDSALVHHSSYIAGQFQSGRSGHFAVHNPADGSLLALVAEAGATEAEQAVSAAAAAFPAWSGLTAAERSAKLMRWSQLMLEHQQDLARILTLEQGKPLDEAAGEISYGASFVSWFAEEAKRMNGDIIPAAKANQQILVLKQAIGVVAAITPWNFPNAMILRKAAAALAAGCTFVVKPAELTPLSALALAELASRAGIPAGVFNVVTGTDAKAIGQVLTKDSRVAKFSFTGSTPVGKTLLAQCASTVKKVSMELGGNAPFIVFDDADLTAAVQGLLAAKFRNAGQTCVCVNRVFVQRPVYDAFLALLIKATAPLKLASGLEAGCQIGPLINQAAVDKITRLLDQALDQGAELLLGGAIDADLGPLFFQPTIVTDVTPGMQISQTEIFGPVLCISLFDTEQEVIELANNTPTGLASYFYSRDIGRIFRVAKALDYGMIGVNEGLISNAAAPFGGVKESGLGREGSSYGLDDFTELKYICLGGLS